jgi:hypothetical protein
LAIGLVVATSNLHVLLRHPAKYPRRPTRGATPWRSGKAVATKGDGGVLSEQEILELLSEAARCGCVPAMRELRAYCREHRTLSDDPLARFDELAARRSTK